MSSKNQLSDYVKTLKAEFKKLKQESEKLSRENLSLKFRNSILEASIKISQSKERKWYHFF